MESREKFGKYDLLTKWNCHIHVQLPEAGNKHRGIVFTTRSSTFTDLAWNLSPQAAACDPLNMQQLVRWHQSHMTVWNVWTCLCWKESSPSVIDLTLYTSIRAVHHAKAAHTQKKAAVYRLLTQKIHGLKTTGLDRQGSSIAKHSSVGFSVQGAKYLQPHFLLIIHYSVFADLLE